MDEDCLLISGIQHFCFCRRQWALIHVENVWNENELTAEGRILHERVHDSAIATSRSGILVFRGLPVRSSRLRITGECDAVEFVPDSFGIAIKGKKGLWRAQPVEYKKGRPIANECDRLQLAAECVCLEEMLGCDIRKGYLFYFGTRHRQEVEIGDELREKLEDCVKEMWDYYERGYTPRVRVTKSCRSCSMAELCVPKLMAKDSSRSVSEYISAHVREE